MSVADGAADAIGGGKLRKVSILNISLDSVLANGCSMFEWDGSICVDVYLICSRQALV